MSTRGSVVPRTIAFGVGVRLSACAAVFAGVLGAWSSGARADEAASTLSPPPLTLSLTAGVKGGPWKLKVENTGDVPVRLAANPRLLVLEVTPPAGFVDPTAKKRPATAKPGEPKTVRCVLPDDARPATDEGRELVIPSKRSWSATVDPLLYCFGPHERAALVTGATVQARFGWPSPPARAGAATKKPAPATGPFVAAPVGAALGRIAPTKILDSAPITLSEDANLASLATAPSGPLVVSMGESLDAFRGNEIATTVNVENVGDRPLVLLLRAETVRFSVAGPAGSVVCGNVRTIDAPIRELYSTLSPKGHASLNVLITAVCPADTFDEPGIYRVTPVLDTSGASARSIGIKTWDDVAVGRSPMLLRVRTPRRPARSPVRPALD